MSLLDTVWNFIAEWKVVFIIGATILLLVFKDKIFSLFKKKKKKEDNTAVFKNMQSAEKFNLREKRVLAQRWIDYTLHHAAELKQKELELSIERDDLKKKHDYYQNKMKLLDVLIQEEERGK